MKKILMAVMVAVLGLMTLSSCSSDNKYGTHKFLIVTKVNVIDATDRNLIVAKIAEDPYFSSQPTYEGKFYDCVELAIQEFKQHCNALDADFIESHLKDPNNDYVRINLWSCDPAQNWVACVFRSSFWKFDMNPSDEE